MAPPMDDPKLGGLRVDSDRCLKLEFHGFKVTSDAGLLAYREIDEPLGLTEVAGELFQESRTGKNVWHGLKGQFHRSVLGRLGGYDDVNDAERLGRDPTIAMNVKFIWVISGKIVGSLRVAWIKSTVSICRITTSDR